MRHCRCLGLIADIVSQEHSWYVEIEIVHLLLVFLGCWFILQTMFILKILSRMRSKNIRWSNMSIQSMLCHQTDADAKHALELQLFRHIVIQAHQLPPKFDFPQVGLSRGVASVKGFRICQGVSHLSRWVGGLVIGPLVGPCHTHRA
jgi:hypothetical protein